MGVFEAITAIMSYPTTGSQGMDPKLLQAAQMLYPQKAMEEQMSAYDTAMPQGRKTRKPQYFGGLATQERYSKLDEKQMLLGSMADGSNSEMLLGN